MRSLPILLIALALLPLSAARQCYQGKSYNGDTSALQEVTCPAGHNHCGKFGASVGDQSEHTHQCVWCTAIDTCHEERLGGVTGTMCCCSTDFCNPAPSTPSLLLPSLAALAAVLAAHF
ncbi:hypothetical protein PRIPAC_91667 [Pristionchus pacificus]|uniref:Uncharacterized protein n=1 Tax=Pristionchus pacificus TaxID=54126 RepID=A0A454Y0K6_PRIPA|nr:hypothetical protein PRIPAC_91667 [Pristionchus pacificus]|eukprot:PDM62663.1 hypothetical protein PRIPAC_49878 [Pristionchus pacificus]